MSPALIILGINVFATEHTEKKFCGVPINLRALSGASSSLLFRVLFAWLVLFVVHGVDNKPNQEAHVVTLGNAAVLASCSVLFVCLRVS